MNTRICKLLTIVLIWTALFIYPVESSAATAFDTATYRSSHYQGQSVHAVLEGSQIKFMGLPEGSGYNYVKVAIKNNSGTQKAGGYYSRKELLTDGKRIELKKLANGQYQMELFFSKEKYAVYNSYIYGKNLLIYMKAGKATFVEPPVFMNNKGVKESKRDDSKALAYYLESTKAIQSDSPKIKELASRITKGHKTDYAKAKAIHDWVCNNIWYDMDVFTGKTRHGDTSALATLEKKKNICEGYSSLTVALLRASGIPSKLVRGYALGIGESTGWTSSTAKSAKANHTWNEAYVDGRWIIMDTTWDTNNKYSAGKYSTGTGLIGYRYFDATLEGLSLSHRLNDYLEMMPKDTASAVASTSANENDPTN